MSLTKHHTLFRPALFRPIWRRLAAAVLFAAVTLLIGPGPATAEPRIALVIGNGKYGQEIGALINPPNDANLIAERLSGLGFKVTKLLNGDQKAMKRAIVDFGENLTTAGPDAVGLFFYAGHGISIKGENYLIPVGAQMTREADAEIEAIKAEWVLTQMQFAANRVNIVILDSCRNNPLPRSMRSADRGMARMDAPTGSFIGYATAPGEVAADGDGKNSPYSAALAAELGKPGIAIEEAFRNVRVRVMNNTDSQQVPWDSSSLTGAFYFQPGAASVAATTATTTAPADAVNADRDFWNMVQSSTDASEFDAYLARFPDGAYADLARARAARLRKDTPKAGERSPTPSASATPQTKAPQEQVAAIEPPPPVAEDAPGPAPDGSLVLSAKVAGMMHNYLLELRFRNGAFAVSPDGAAAGYFVCESIDQCVPGKKSAPQNTDRAYPQRRALQKCGGLARQECVILLIRDQERLPYAVAAD